MGVVPATKILDENAQGFFLEVFLCGEKSMPLPLGGIKGMAGLFATIREIPEFSKVPVIPSSIEQTKNILISTVDFADDVSSFLFGFVIYLLYLFSDLIIFSFFFQVYKIENSDVGGKGIYIAGSSLYQLIQKEQGIMLAALSYNTESDEKQFEEKVDAAVMDFHAFTATKWINASTFEIDLYTNFSEFFDLIIDIKKHENSRSTAAAVVPADIPTAADTAVTAGGDVEEPAAKKYMRRK